jgi:plasmid stabilization system protein ParE
MYRVRWTRKASNQLAEIWNIATDRNAIAAASHRIDQALASDPENQGEDRPNNRRVLFEPPLLVFYRIDNSNHTVIVSFVGRYGTGSP